MKAEAIDIPYMINWKLLKDSKRYIELKLQGTDQARTFARYAMSEVQQEKFYEVYDESMWGQSFNMHIRKTREFRQKKETPTKQ